MMTSTEDKECCMCGDYGLSSELLPCKHCQFRSQHKYCSNLYPRSKSYDICNWCLSTTSTSNQQKNNTSTQNSSSSASSLKTTTLSSTRDQRMKKKTAKKKMVITLMNNDDQMRDRRVDLDRIRRSNKFRDSLKKKNITTNTTATAEMDEKKLTIRRTKSEDTSSNGRLGVIKHVFRNKVRRYKFLDQVST